MRWSGWRPTGNGRITTRGRVVRISSMSFARDGSSFWRWASGSPALSRACTPSARVARSASAARVVASPRVPVSPWVKSMIPTRWPARTALASVPPQVSSTSSRWAAIARRSTRWEVTPRVRMRNAECGVRNEPSERRTPWPAVRIGLSASIPHSAFRTPHWCSFVSQRLDGIQPRGSRRRRDPEDEPHRDRRDRRDRRTPHRDRKSTRLNSSHSQISYAVFCLKKKNKHTYATSFITLIYDPTETIFIYLPTLKPCRDHDEFPHHVALTRGLCW